MPVLLLVLFSAIAVFAEDLPAVAPGVPVSANLSIPARLSRTIDTKKCKAGDVVEMKTLEPVLIGNGLVMPENAKLHGRIVAAASRQNEKPSWLLLVMEGAEWKEHSIPLHAFVTSQITMKAQVSGQNDSTFQSALDLPDRVLSGRRGARQLPQATTGGTLSASTTHTPRDATVEGSNDQQLSYHGVDDLRLLKNKNGTVFLVSQRDHLKLPSGTMLMLRNQPAAEPTEAGAKKTAGSGQ